MAAVAALLKEIRVSLALKSHDRSIKRHRSICHKIIRLSHTRSVYHYRSLSIVNPNHTGWGLLWPHAYDFAVKILTLNIFSNNFRNLSHIFPGLRRTNREWVAYWRLHDIRERLLGSFMTPTISQFQASLCWAIHQILQPKWAV